MLVFNASKNKCAVNFIISMVKLKPVTPGLFRVVGSLLTITFQIIFLREVILHESEGLLLMQWGWIQSIFMHKILQAEQI